MPFGNENAIFIPVWLGEAAVLQEESLPVWVLVPAMDQYGRCHASGQFSNLMDQYGRRHASGQFSNLLLEGIERLWEAHEILPNPKRFSLATEKSVL